MKKIPSFIAIFIIAWSAHAQTLIPKAGVTFNGVAVDDGHYSNSQDIKVGFTVGAASDIPISGIFSVQPEVNFVRKGYDLKQKWKDQGIDYTAHTQVTLNYLEIPVLAKASFGKTTKYYFMAGPSLGVGVKGKYSVTQTYVRIGPTGWDIEEVPSKGKVKFGDAPENPDEDDDNIYIKSLDVSLQTGAGLIIAEKLILELRYVMGFTELSSEDFTVNTLKNRMVAFTVGIPIQFK